MDPVKIRCMSLALKLFAQARMNPKTIICPKDPQGVTAQLLDYLIKLDSYLSRLDADILNICHASRAPTLH